MDELQRIKELLLKKELKSIEELKLRYEGLRKDIKSEDFLIKKISPALNGAIRDNIKSSKDAIVDSLYPIIGNMLTKYVSRTFEDMINSINTKIKKRLSFRAFSRKIRAKIKGVSETELLIEESNKVYIKTLFLIDKSSGIVLSTLENKNTKIIEPEMVVSMLTAIRSFVNEWIEQNEENKELNTIDYGGSNIIIESSSCCYLAAIIDGVITNKTRKRLEESLFLVVSKYGVNIREFDGNLSKLPIKEINKELLPLLDYEEYIEEDKSIHPLIYIFPIAIISIVLYFIYLYIIDTNLEKRANELLYKNPSLTIYRLETEVKDRDIFINGIVPNIIYKDMVDSEIKKLEKINKVINNIQVIENTNSPKDIYDKISYLQLALNQKEGNKIEYTYTYPNLKVFGSVINQAEKQHIQRQFDTIKGLDKVEFDIKILPPKIDEVIHFDLNSSIILENQEYKLIKIINLLHKLDNDLTLEIYAFRDFTGTIERNEMLVKERAQAIMKYLKVKGNVSQKLIDIGKNEVPKEIEEEYPEQGRQVVFKWKK